MRLNDKNAFRKFKKILFSRFHLYTRAYVRMDATLLQC